MEQLVEVRQLPIIVEQLHLLKNRIEETVGYALSLECNEDTYKQIKAMRSQINKEFKELDALRIDVKRQILVPFNDFEAAFKECVSNVVTPAVSRLTGKINTVEDSLKESKKAELREYFNECCQSKRVFFLNFEDAGINVTLSASLKSLKEKVKSFVDRVSDDVATIETLEHSAEIFVEYKHSLNASIAIQTVNARHRAIEDEKLRAEHRKAFEARQAETVAKVEEVLTAPTVTDDVAEPSEVPEELKFYCASFKVKTSNIDDLKALVEFMKERGIEYEQF